MPVTEDDVKTFLQICWVLAMLALKIGLLAGLCYCIFKQNVPYATYFGVLYLIAKD